MNTRACRQSLAVIWWLLASALVRADGGDWRQDLLESSGIASDPASIESALAARQQPDAGFKAAYARLGSDSFRVREQAHAEFLAGGTAALDWLARKPVPSDPEVRHRHQHIMRALAASPPAMRESLLLHAMRSLLDENTRKPGAGGIFYEWFGVPAADCIQGYRLMRYQGPPDGGLSEVRDGRLILRGGRPGDLDQRLILHTADWPGIPDLPGHLTLRVLLGGTSGGRGAWHIAVSIGDVKTLFHPEFQGGGFRHEQAGTRAPITQNTDMGFTPGADQVFDMTLHLDRATPTHFSLKTTILAQDGSLFENEALIAEEHFGGLKSIALERSGRTGGDAFFEQVSLTLRSP